MLPFLLVVFLMLSVSSARAEGDVAYGEYLSSECVTCHQATESNGGIPSIHGYDAEGMRTILRLYRSKKLDNATMQTIASRLTDEDIEALAAYFSIQLATE